MAEVKPLRLRVEKAQRVRATLADLPYCEVLVNLPFFQPQEVFTYKLVQGCEFAAPGDLVSVPYGHSLVEGVILRRSAEVGTTSRIKSVHALISQSPVFTPEQIELAGNLAKRYATDSWSFLRSAAPPYSKLGEKASLQREDEPSVDSGELSASHGGKDLPKSLLKALRSSAPLRELVLLPAFNDPHRAIMEIALLRSKEGKAVIVLPDRKDLQACSRILSESGIAHIINDSSQSKSERFSSYLRANQASHGLVLTLRNGALLHLGKSDTLVVYNEVESHHYERRSPTWNTRDISLLRSAHHSVIYVSHSPSVEIVRQVENGWLRTHLYPTTKVRGMTFLTPDGGEPEIFADIGRALKKGNVLISVAHAGYINGFSCGQCRTKASCSCGGRLKVPLAGADPVCSICEEVKIAWRCPWCDSPKMWATIRGAQRTASEFGRAFSKVRVLQSSGASQIAELPEGISLVIATLGSEPSGRYSGIFILDAQVAYSQVDLRSQEDVRVHWFKLLSQLQPDGDFYLSLPASEVIAQGLIRCDPYELASREMRERFDASLPPYFRILICEAPFAELTAIADLLTARGFLSFSLPKSAKGVGRLLVKYEVGRGEEFAELISGLQRVRVAQKKEPFALRFDPYSIA